MKRSQAIESIVYNCLSWDGLNTSGVPLEEIANDILTHLEKIGMKPPVYEGLITTCEEFDKIKHQGRDTTFFRTWEPE